MKKRSKNIYIMLSVSIMLTVALCVVFAHPLDSAEEPASYAPENVEAEDFVDYTKKIQEERNKEIPPSEIIEEEFIPEEEKEDEFKLIYPVEGEIILPFSDNKLIYSKTMNDYRVHSGIDIGAKVLSRVYATEDGVIESVKEDSLMGKTIIIDHLNGFKSIYKNLSSTEMVNEGDNVEKGDIISGVGESALVEIKEESHLHFELTKDGVTVNPQDYIKF